MPRFQCVPATLPTLNGFRVQSAIQAAGHGSANWVPTRFPPGSCNMSPRHAVAGVSYCHTVCDLQPSVQLLRNRKHSVAQNRSQQSHIHSRKLLSDSHCAPPPCAMCIECEYQSVGEMAKKNRASIRLPGWGSMDERKVEFPP